ncbi:DNA replication/repair protein RecF [Pararhodobacter sp.]|uniref:DNA replication/repair protein RecF n=1 Tax=Pararhodobacter sp. TaxID=2127056 RepID=UPI002FDC7DE4
MALRLTHLKLSHFRSHQRTEAAFDGRPVVFLGANGAGKTNLIEAISLLSPGRGLRRAAPEELIRQPQGIGWKITATIARGDALHEVETGALPGQPRSLRIDGKAAPQSALGRVASMLWLTPAMDRLWIEAAEGRRRFLDRMVLAFVPDHAEAALGYEKAMRQRNRLLRDHVADGAWYGALEAQMAQSGAQLSANRRMVIARLAQASDPSSAFPAADLTLSCDAPTDEPALAQALAGSRRADMAAGRSLLGPHRADLGAVWRAKGMSAAQCSTGEQKALLLSLVLANARALAADTGTPPILLLDELAAHLDATRRAALFDELCALGAQVFLTGTEPALFAPLGPRAHWFTLTDDGGHSRLAESPQP